MFNRLKKKKEDKGFICPSCMQNFSSAEEVQSHFQEQHNVQRSVDTEDQEGFLCPVCKVSLSSPEMLQSHYDAEHNEDPVPSDNSYTKKNEFAASDTREFRKELESLQSQLRSSEEKRASLSSKMFHSEQKSTQLSLQIEILKTEKKGLELKTAQLTEKISSLKTTVEESEELNKSQENHIQSIKRQLKEKSAYAHKLEGDLAEKDSGSEKNRLIQEEEIVILKKELTTMKSLMEKMILEKEKEKLALEQEHSNIRLIYDMKNKEVEELKVQLQKAPKSDDFLRLEVNLSEREMKLKELKNFVGRLESDLVQVNESKQKLQEQVSQMSKAAADRQADISQLQKDLLLSEEEKKHRHNQLLAAQTDLTQSRAELTRTQTRLDQTLKLNEELMANMSGLQVQLDEREDSLSQALQETDNAKEVAEEQRLELETLKRTLQDMTQELETAKKVLGSHESTSQLAISQKDKQILALNSRVEELQMELCGKQADISELGHQLLASNDFLEKERLKSKELKTEMMEKKSSLEEEIRKLAQCEERLKGFEDRIEYLSQERLRLEHEKQELISKINEGDGFSEVTRQLTQENVLLQEKLSMLESALKNQETKLISREETLHRQIQELRNQLLDSDGKVAQLEANLEEKSAKLKQSQQKLTDVEAYLTTKKEMLIASEANVSKEKEELQNNVSTLNSLLDKTNSDLAATRSQLEQSNRDLATKKEKLVQLEAKLQKQKDKISQASQKSKMLDRELRDKNTRLIQTEEVVREKTQEVETSRLLVAASTEKLMKAEQDLDIEKRSKMTELNNLSKEIEKLTLENIEIMRKHDELKFQVADFESRQREKNQEVEAAHRDLANIQAELLKSQEMMAKTKESSDEQLVYLTSLLEDERSKVEEAKRDLAKQVMLLKEEQSSWNQEKMAFLNQILCLNQGLEQRTLDRDRLARESDEKKAIHQADMFNLQNKLDEVTMSREQHKKEATTFRTLLEKEQEENNKKVTTLTAAKDLMLQQKIAAESEVVYLRQETDVLSKQLALLKHETNEVHNTLRLENSQFLEKLSAQVSAYEALKSEKEEMEADFEKETTILSENLTAVRTDLTIAEGNLIELTRLNDSLLAEKLELGANLERSKDERKSLIERCMASEVECQKLRENLASHRSQLDEIQGALHELGRENQTLQIITTKVKNRKWAEDEDITECTSCGKMFSVTIRKHHCRNCGFIFCHDCSSKMSQTPMVKKPVRVCDPCFRELNVPRK